MNLVKHHIEQLIEFIGDYEKCFGCVVPYDAIGNRPIEEKIATLRIAIGTRSPIKIDRTAKDAACSPHPSEHFENHFRRSRLQMVRDQLRRHERPITNRRVLRAMRKVPREAFIPRAVWDFAYENRPLPIGWGQTISQPYIVGLMTQLLNPKKTGHILEIGTGSGYQSAVLAELAESVFSIELVPELAQRSRAILGQLGYTNVRVIEGDGSKGWPEPQTFDGILITCATPIIPEALLAQLKPGGTLIAPIGGVDEQKLSLYIKNEKLERKTIIKVRCVPMQTAYCFQEIDLQDEFSCCV
jgi:protein-L-isoaspartate(D-aspartate) O-methyltransferase